MITTPQIADTPAQAIAFIHLTVGRDEIMKAMQSSLGELKRVLEEQEVTPAGPWFTHHLRRPSESFDLRICFPVDTPVTPSGRVEAGQRDAARVARTVYSGNYTGLASAWGKFRDWLDSNNCSTRDDLWEVYLVGPEASSRPEDWRTELNRPLV